MLGLMAAAILACAPPAGTDALLARPERIIIVGEIHGTREIPAAFGQIVCAAAARGPVVVALEMSDSAMPPRFEAFLAAETDPQAMAGLEGSPLLDPRFNDGRSSQAVLALLFQVRRWREAGLDITLHAFQPSLRRPSQTWSELDMAHSLSLAAIERPDARILVLVGNIHAAKAPLDRLPNLGLPAAAHLPRQETLSLNIAQQGGESWSCRQDGCGVSASMATTDPARRGVFLIPSADGAYDGELAVGPWSASPPIREGD